MRKMESSFWVERFCTVLSKNKWHRLPSAPCIELDLGRNVAEGSYRVLHDLLGDRIDNAVLHGHGHQVNVVVTICNGNIRNQGKC